ncbi:MAG: ATP-binding protein [Chloroflexota bacterium]
MNFPFHGRLAELEVLDRLWASAHAEFLIVYGRRRVGKTALLTEWIHRTGNRALYWVASPTSTHVQLRSFSQAVFNFAHPGAPAPEGFSYASWEQAFQEVTQLAKDSRLALIIDEFTYLLEIDPGIAGLLQNTWDHAWRKADLFLCLSGSHLGMMKREFLSYQSPLYGRASAQVHLQPFHFGATRDFFPKYSAVDRVALYSIFGGVPAYWERVDPSKSISRNIKTNLLTPNNLLQSEPRLLLQDFISDPHNYLAILGAIAGGAHITREIAEVSGLPSVQLPKYLGVLIETGFVERRVPVTETGPSRAGRYHITDPYLRFYFRFLADRQDQLALGAQELALAEINRHLIDFIGKYTWEELSREWALRAGAKGLLPMQPDRVGSAWDARVQVDVAGINSREKTLLLGECKWTRTANERKVMAELVGEKAAKIVPAQGKWRVFFLGFSRSGWTAGARAYADEINQTPVQGANWVSNGMRLLTLEELDRDLAQWTK